MQATKILQVVILMLILAMAASCAAGRQYSSRVFAPRQPVIKDSQSTGPRFLAWGEDSIQEASPVLVKEESQPVQDSVAKVQPVAEQVKPVIPSIDPVVKTVKPGSVRTKRTRNDQ